MKTSSVSIEWSDQNEISNNLPPEHPAQERAALEKGDENKPAK